jgi:hypothetical protein
MEENTVSRNGQPTIVMTGWRASTANGFIVPGTSPTRVRSSERTIVEKKIATALTQTSTRQRRDKGRPVGKSCSKSVAGSPMPGTQRPRVDPATWRGTGREPGLATIPTRA